MQECRTITRKSASNLALAFVLLPREKREAMSALYAFCREVDDIADTASLAAETRRQQLQDWRLDVRRACGTETPRLAVNRELQPVIRQYRLPIELFESLLDGVEMDLDTLRYESYEDLDLYCYRVASVVGLLSIEIFGYRNSSCRDYAVHLGKALQLTNILRDVRNDAVRGRIYLPLSELRRCGVTEGQILRFEYTPGFCEVARGVARRARQCFGLARQSLPPEDRRAMVAAELMGAVYWHLLRKLEARAFSVLDPRPVKLGKAAKAVLIAWTRARFLLGRNSPRYGI